MYVAAAQLLTTDLGYTLHKTALGQATLNMHTWALIEILIDQISYVLIDSARQWWSDCSKIVSNQELMDDDVQVSMARRWWLIPAQYAMGGCWNWFMSMTVWCQFVRQHCAGLRISLSSILTFVNTWPPHCPVTCRRRNNKTGFSGWRHYMSVGRQRVGTRSNCSFGRNYWSEPSPM